MPDGCKPELDGGDAFAFWGSQVPASPEDVQQGLARAWRLMLASQIEQALRVLRDTERQLDNLAPPFAARYRAASRLVRSAILAFQDDSVAVLSIVTSVVFVKEDAGLTALLREAHSQTERFESAVGRPVDAAWQAAPDCDVITVRERDVLSMISHGRSNKHIARTLKISPETVKSHVKRIFSKLSVNTRTEAVSRAMSLRLL
jgi:DNA-binding CsgD family transcriptional regulator